MATSWSGGVNFEVGAKAFAEKINYLSDGRINIQAFQVVLLVKLLKFQVRLKMESPNWSLWMGYDWGR